MKLQSPNSSNPFNVKIEIQLEWLDLVGSPKKELVISVEDRVLKIVVPVLSTACSQEKIDAMASSENSVRELFTLYPLLNNKDCGTKN